MFSFCFFNQSAEIVAERKNPPPPPPCEVTSREVYPCEVIPCEVLPREVPPREVLPREVPPRPVFDENAPIYYFVDPVDRPRVRVLHERRVRIEQQKWDAKYGQQADVHSTGNVLGAH
jgi:hypothetical protein